MNYKNVLLIVFVIIFIIFSLLSVKLSIKDVFINYFKIYRGGYDKKKNKYKINYAAIISYGLLPYLIGTFFVLSFVDKIISIDQSFLLQINGMLMTVLVIFFGFDVYCRDNDSIKRKSAIGETNATILIALFLILIDSIVLILSNVFSNEVINVILLCVYYSFMLKIVLLVFIILHNVFKLNIDNNSVQ